MTRQDIINEVHKHIAFMREQWREFCEWMETNAEKMAHCQEEQWGEYYRMIEKHPADLEGYKRAKARIDEENKRLQAQGWNLWKFMYEYNYLKLPYISTSFYAPPEVVNPGLWIIENDNGAVNTNQREPKPEESLLCDYAILCYTHDHNVSKGEPRIYFQGTYAGKYFVCDEFCYRIPYHDWSAKRLKRAYNNVKPHLDEWLEQREAPGKAGQGDRALPDYRALDLAKRAVTIGSNTSAITSDRVWDFLRDLCSARRDDRLVPSIERATNNKNNVDQLRRQIGNAALHKLILFVDGGYKLNPDVKILSGAQIGIRRTKTGREPKRT